MPPTPAPDDIPAVSGQDLLKQRLADLRHDLRTPVGHILGFSEFLLEEVPEENQSVREDLERIHTAGKRLLTMIEERITLAGFGDVRGEGAEPVASTAPPVAGLSLIGENGDIGEHPVSESGLFLVADDNAENCHILARWLERLGHRTVTATTGDEVLTLLASQSVDLVFLDLMMPGQDGYAVLQQMKTESSLANVPVIMVSALNEIDSVARCIEMGAEDFLIKPINPILLKARVTNCLQSKRVRDLERQWTATLQENLARLQAAEKMRDDLTGMIVHDLRTPLTSLLTGLMTLNYLGNLSAEQREMLDLSIRGAQSLLGMINDLLDVSKGEGGSLKLHYGGVNSDALIAGAVQQVDFLARDAGLNLVVEVADGLPEFIADEEKLRRTLVNLLGNAIKFTPSGGTITVRAAVDSPDHMRFTVQDTGEGIPEEAFTRIFEKFGQVEDRKAGRKTGTGLGLTFCKIVVEAHGGQIGVRSQVGAGSTFWFTLPPVPPDSPPDPR